jgi:hypothetical protein
VLSGRGLCYELITRPEESYRLWCVFVCDLETSRIMRPWPALDRSATEKKKFTLCYHTILMFSNCLYFKGRNNGLSCYRKNINWTYLGAEYWGKYQELTESEWH